MANTRQYFCRPIEITTDNNTLGLTWTGGGPSAFSIPVGLYANIFSVVGSLRDQMAAIDSDLYAMFADGMKVRIGTSSGVISGLAWADEALGRLLGYRSTESTGAYIDATDTPQNGWLPSYYSYDDQRFHLNQSEVWKGSRSVVGRLSGVQLISGQYSRTFKFDANPATNVFREAAQDVVTWTGVDYYPEQERCFEQFMLEARTASLTATTSENLNPTGFYYIHDWSDYTDSDSSYPDDPDSGGVNFDLDSSPDTYVFCTPDPRGPSMPAMLGNTAKNYYSVEFEVVTATAPAWSAP